MSNKGCLMVVSGPSGAGKSTVIEHLGELRQDFVFSISATTRAPRPGESDGVEYYFVTREEFLRMVEDGELLEHAEFVGNFYGTPRAPVLRQLETGEHMLLDIEVQGAAQVKSAMPEAVTVFLSPPSLQELERRLRSRGTETEEKIRGRLERAQREMELAPQYDYQVINDDPLRAAQELSAILDRSVTNNI